MISWEIGVLVALGVLWWATLSFARVWLDDDVRAMRDYRRARERFEDHFE